MKIDVATNDLAASRVLRPSALPAHTMPNGGESRSIVHGQLLTGEQVNLHGSMQPAGATPNPAHPIQHSELFLIQEGTLELLHDGKIERGGPGSIFYVAKGTVHQIRNAGDVPAKYTVVAIGGDVNANDTKKG